MNDTGKKTRVIRTLVEEGDCAYELQFWLVNSPGMTYYHHVGYGSEAECLEAQRLFDAGREAEAYAMLTQADDA